MAPGDKFTPGRISWVYFNHKGVVNTLRDKPPGWFGKTAGNLDGIGEEYSTLEYFDQF